MASKRLKRKLRAITRALGLTLSFDTLRYPHFEPVYGRICIPKEYNDYQAIISFSHELAHAFESLSGPYRDYHWFAPAIKTEAYIQQALKAERHVDTVAKEICQAYFGNVRYVSGYGNTKRSLAFLRKHYQTY